MQTDDDTPGHSPGHPPGSDLFADIRARVLAALRAIVPDLDPTAAARVEVTPTRDPAHGDMATNAALLAARPARRKPADIAAALAASLASDPLVQKAEPAGPGFVNLTLRPEAFQAVLPAILRTGEAYGDSRVGQGITVNVEYVSANPTGPLHVGHCRGAIVGDALANLLLRAGYRVVKEYLINDAGGQVTALAWAAYWRYLQALGRDPGEAAIAAAAPGGLQYRGEYLIPVGEALAARHGDAFADAIADSGIMARHRARLRGGRDAARHSRGSGAARRDAGRVRVGARAGAIGCGRCRHRATYRRWAGVSRHAGTAEGQAAGRLGTA